MNTTSVVLLVEDEPIMLIHAQDALEEAGFKVIEASSGEEAAKLLKSHRSDVIAMVTDIRLGSGINGWELAREARERNASLPVVYLTAETAEDWAAQGVPKSVLVQKPYAAAQLVVAVSTLINETNSTA